MKRLRFRVVFILLVLILLVASALFGMLTYWLDGTLLPVSGSRRGGEVPSWSVPRLEMESPIDSFGGKSLLQWA